MEKITPVRTFTIEYRCDNCKCGIMKYTGNSITQRRTEHKHKCTDCKEKVYFKYRYPRITYENIIENEYDYSDGPGAQD